MNQYEKYKRENMENMVSLNMIRTTFILLFLALLVWATGDYDYDNCGKAYVAKSKRDAPSDRIPLHDKFIRRLPIPLEILEPSIDNLPILHSIGSTYSEILPWAAFISVNREVDATNISSACGGTLISKRHILTAAHCFLKDEEGECSTSQMLSQDDVIKGTEVRIGGICSREDTLKECDQSKMGNIYTVKRAYFSGFFEHSCHSEDIALLELTDPVPDDNYHVCLPHLHNLDPLNKPETSLLAWGWGTDPMADTEGTTSSRLLKLDLGIQMPFDECRAKNPDVPSDIFCIKEKRTATVCQGDSGGGITTLIDDRTYVVGIISGGTSCIKLINGAKPNAVLNTDIRKYTELINDFIDEKPKNSTSQ